MDESVITLVGSYLSERYIILEAEGNTNLKRINSGVPQGSVLGPTLWNILYNNLLEIVMPQDVRLIGFADDVALMVTAASEDLLMSRANTALQRISRWMERRKLRLAPEKTEAVLLTKKRKINPVKFKIENVNIEPTRVIKYLGVWLDTKLSFTAHIKKTCIKANKTTAALSRLLPNIGGCRASKRKILASVVHSQILYAAPIWQVAMNNKKLRQKLLSVQRTILIRVCCAYRTISCEGVNVITGTPPIDLLAKERKDRYNGLRETEARVNLIRQWQEKWENGYSARWTYRIIPDIQAWINRPYGEVDYFLTQALSGHGCFRKYLFDRRRAESDNCVYCSGSDDVEHTLFVCPRWDRKRQEYEAETNRNFCIENLSRSLIETEESWIAAYKIVRYIIEVKEREDR